VQPLNYWHLRHAARVLRLGGIVAHATEAVFGLACTPASQQALDALLKLKSRGYDKGLILLGANPEQVLGYAAPIDAEHLQAVMASWPGPVSWVFPASTGLDWRLTGGRDTIALRVTAHRQAAQLCRHFGSALVSTSANVSGHGPALTELAVRRGIRQGIDYILPGHVGGRRRPSQIKDARSGQIIRPS